MQPFDPVSRSRNVRPIDLRTHLDQVTLLNWVPFFKKL
jgi:hypothetical protein